MLFYTFPNKRGIFFLDLYFIYAVIQFFFLIFVLLSSLSLALYGVILRSVKVYFFGHHNQVDEYKLCSLSWAFHFFVNSQYKLKHFMMSFLLLSLPPSILIVRQQLVLWTSDRTIIMYLSLSFRIVVNPL